MSLNQEYCRSSTKKNKSFLKISYKTFEELNHPNSLAVYLELNYSPGISYKDIGRARGMCSATVQKSINYLVKNGFIEKLHAPYGMMITYRIIK